VVINSIRVSALKHTGLCTGPPHSSSPAMLACKQTCTCTYRMRAPVQGPTLTSDAAGMCSSKEALRLLGRNEPGPSFTEYDDNMLGVKEALDRPDRSFGVRCVSAHAPAGSMPQRSARRGWPTGVGSIRGQGDKKTDEAGGDDKCRQ